MFFNFHNCPLPGFGRQLFVDMHPIRGLCWRKTLPQFLLANSLVHEIGSSCHEIGCADSHCRASARVSISVVEALQDDVKRLTSASILAQLRLHLEEYSDYLSFCTDGFIAEMTVRSVYIYSQTGYSILGAASWLYVGTWHWKFSSYSSGSLTPESFLEGLNNFGFPCDNYCLAFWGKSCGLQNINIFNPPLYHTHRIVLDSRSRWNPTEWDCWSSGKYFFRFASRSNDTSRSSFLKTPLPLFWDFQGIAASTYILGLRSLEVSLASW